MGRRVSVDKSQTKVKSRGIDAHEDHGNQHSAGKAPSGGLQSFHRTPPLPHKQWPVTSEHGPRVAATGFSNIHLLLGSSDSFESDPERTSRDIRSPSRSSHVDRFDSSAAKSMFASTGRAVKRHASKLSLASSISFDKDDEGNVVWKLSGLGASVPAPESIQQSSARKDTLKRAISAPFDFKHVTHTYQDQVRGLGRATRNELISEFSAIRAGQRPDAGLRGIKADALLTKDTSSSPGQEESRSKLPTPSIDTESPIAAPSSRSKSHSTGSSIVGELRGPRAVENFSRPVSRTSFSPIPPPRRISSLNAFAPVIGGSGDALGANARVRGWRTYPQRMSQHTMNPASLLVSSNLPDQDGDMASIGHAISTTDDSARHLKASPLPMVPVDLDDVPEDEEGFVHCENRTSSVGCRVNRSLSLRHVQTFPASRHDGIQVDQLGSQSLKPQRHATSLEQRDTRTDVEDCQANWPISPSQVSCRNSKRFSIGLKPMCETQDWQQDVDYCYEHAAEAESDFDWDHQVANFSVGLESSSVFNPGSLSKSNPACELQHLAGLGLHHGRNKHDSQESSVLSIASSIIDISKSTNSVGSLPELDYSINSSRESMDWETGNKGKRSSSIKPSRRSPPPPPTPVSPAAKSPRPRGQGGLGLSYSLFPANTTPPRTP